MIFIEIFAQLLGDAESLLNLEKDVARLNSLNIHILAGNGIFIEFSIKKGELNGIFRPISIHSFAKNFKSNRFSGVFFSQ